MSPDLPTFAGRQDLLRRLGTLLRPAGDPVAVCIVGLGGVAGVGTSSLVVHAAHRWRDRFPDGVVWADLGSENAACDALRLVARLYGFHQQAAQVGDAPRPLVALVRTILQGKRVLLVLDNAEGLTPDELDCLLLDVPGTVTVVTSREAFPALERMGEPIRVGVMDEEESLALFRCLVGPEQVGADPDAHLALACRLGYLPLGLDIAARCMHDRGWGPAEMLRQLDQAVDLPAFLALPIAGEAWHGVALAFALSYEALDESDQALFRALSVFAPPGFIARDVAAVLDTDDEAGIQAALDRLEALSLVRPSAVLPRYDLHPLLRDYACALAGRAGDRDLWAVRHARHFLALANSASNQLGDPETAFQAVVVAAVERANFLAAQQTCVAQALWDEAVSLAYRLDDLFARTGQWIDRRRALETGVHVACEAGNRRDEAGLSARLGVLAEQEGNYAEARDLYQGSTATFEKLGARQEQAALLDRLATLVCQQGEYADARRLYQQSLDIAQALGDRAGAAMTIRNLGHVAHRQGDEDFAGGQYQEALAIFSELGDRKNGAGVLHELGVLAQAQGDYTEARRRYQQSLDIRQQVGDRRGAADTLDQLGILAQAQGNYARACRLSQKAAEAFEQLGARQEQATVLHRLGGLAQDQGDFAEARRRYQQSLDIRQQLGDRRGVAEVLWSFGTVAYLQGDLDAATSQHRQALAIFRKLGDRKNEAGVLHQLGVLAQAQGDYGEARRYYQRSLDIEQQLGDRRGVALSLAQLALLEEGVGNLPRALQLVREAEAIFTELGGPEALAVRRIRRRIEGRWGDKVTG